MARRMMPLLRSSIRIIIAVVAFAAIQFLHPARCVTEFSCGESRSTVAFAFHAPPPSFHSTRGAGRNEGPLSSRRRRIVERGRRDGIFLSVSTDDNDNDDDDDDDDDGNGVGSREEWRAFRAKLVRNGLPSLGDPPASGDDDATMCSENVENDDRDRLRDRDGHHYAHVTTPLVEVGSILLSVPTTDLCQASEQQYWHRSVVIVTEVCDDLVNGEAFEDAVPEDELANGNRKGRWSHRGLLLNRCTNSFLRGGDDDDEDENGRGGADVVTTEERHERRRIQRGGDLLGLDSSSGRTEFACLHHPSDSGPSSRSDPISSTSIGRKLVGDLSLLSLAEARSAPELDGDDDGLIFAGFCSWRPGQLELEMGEGRNEWIVASVDGESVWKELQNQRTRITATTMPSSKNDDTEASSLLGSGTAAWRAFLDMIDVPEAEAVSRLPSTQLDFYDRMLGVWAEDNLDVLRRGGRAEDVPDVVSVLADSSDSIGPGTIVRAARTPSNDALLHDAEFLRSVVLILEDTADACVGVMLNHPMAAAVECREGGDPLPLRYGGPVDVPSWKDGSYRDVEGGDSWKDGGGDEKDDETMYYEGFEDYLSGGVALDDMVFDFGLDDDEDYDDDGDSSFIWIHRDEALGARAVNGGTELGTSKLWLIKEDDALQALQSGILQLEDTMVFASVCIWEKGPNLGKCGGGLREHVDALRSLEVVRAWNDQNDDNEALECVWDILAKRQIVLTKESLEKNAKAARHAWEICSISRMIGDVSAAKGQNDDDGSRYALSDAALKAWIGINLLEDPLGTFVELKHN